MQQAEIYGAVWGIAEVCVRLRTAGGVDWSPSVAELVCGQGVPQVSVVDMAGTDGQ
jgi:hypothetical protein